MHVRPCWEPAGRDDVVIEAAQRAGQDTHSTSCAQQRSSAVACLKTGRSNQYEGTRSRHLPTHWSAALTSVPDNGEAEMERRHRTRGRRRSSHRMSCAVPETYLQNSSTVPKVKMARKELPQPLPPPRFRTAGLSNQSVHLCSSGCFARGKSANEKKGRSFWRASMVRAVSFLSPFISRKPSRTLLGSKS